MKNGTHKSSAVAEMGDRGHSRHGPKRGGRLLCPFRGRELGPSRTQYGLGRCLLPYQVASSSIQPFGHSRYEPKMARGCAPFSGESLVLIEHEAAWAEAYLHTKWHHSPSSRLATPDIGRKLGGRAPLGEGELGPHLTQYCLGRGLPPYQVAS